MRCSRTSFLAAVAAAAALLLALPSSLAVETLPELRHERDTPSWPGSIAPVTELDVGAYTGRWFQVRRSRWFRQVWDRRDTRIRRDPVRAASMYFPRPL